MKKILTVAAALAVTASIAGSASAISPQPLPPTRQLQIRSLGPQPEPPDSPGWRGINPQPEPPGIGFGHRRVHRQFRLRPRYLGPDGLRGNHPGHRAYRRRP